MTFCWGLILLVGLGRMWSYAEKPGANGAATVNWPLEGRVTRQAGRAILVMTVHPHCPCSRASVGELARLMCKNGDRLSAYVVFNDVTGADAKPEESDLWSTAARIVGVKVLVDPGGAIVRALGAKTSGQTFLYDASGQLRFSGGITGARGHEGANPGEDALEAALNGERGTPVSAPVFGCTLE